MTLIHDTFTLERTYDTAVGEEGEPSSSSLRCPTQR
jgi:hypothetical protein